MKSWQRQLEGNVFRSGAVELQRLHEQVHAAARRRTEGKQQLDTWKAAAQRYFESYDALAFPGGLSKQFDLLQKNDPGAIEMAVRFLEADPWFFRSGYFKADMIRLLRRAPLAEDQRVRLQAVVIDRIMAPETPREFRWYGRLAIAVRDPDLEEQIARIAESSGSVERRHARWILGQLRSRRQYLLPAGH
jgi:hypothetical protein